MSSSVIQARGRYGHAVKTRDVEKIQSAARDLATEKIAAYVEKVVSDAPPLTDAQRSRLAALLSVGVNR